MLLQENKSTARTKATPVVLRKARSLQDNRMRVQLQNNGAPLATQTKSAAVSGERGTVQRAIITKVTDDENLSPQDTAKLNAVEAYLNQSLSHINSKIVTLDINIIRMNGTNPAWTKLNNPGTGILVTVASWFIRVSSVGDICGMITHEIGVHTLAKDQMSDEELSEEKRYEKQPFSVRVGLHTHVISPWDKGKSGRQRDHVNVARDKGNPGRPLRSVQGARKKNSRGEKQKRAPLDRKSENARVQKYAATMLRIGDAIDHDNTISDKEKDKRLHDLLNSYLFDIARILVTNDVAWRALDKTPLIAQAYNWYAKVMVARYGNSHPWLNRKSARPVTTGVGLRTYLGAKTLHAVGHQLIDNARVDRLKERGGELVSRVGSGISRVTPRWVKAGGRMLGNVAGGTGSLLWKGTKGLTGMGVRTAGRVGRGISSTVSNYTPQGVKNLVTGTGNLLSKGGELVGQGLRSVDHLYGEAENLVLPNVTAPVVWGLGKLKSGIGGLGRSVGLWK